MEQLEDDQLLLDEETGFVDDDYDHKTPGERDSAYDSREEDFEAEEAERCKRGHSDRIYTYIMQVGDEWGFKQWENK